MASALESIFAALCLVALSPVFAVAALLVWLDGGRPVFFRQARLGKDGRIFQLLKFRSMRPDRGGTRITAARDARVTRAGAFLRRYKIDEMPQLWNIVRGDMRFVGPRPEVPAFVDLRDDLWRAVLAAKPGLTDLASLVYRHEEDLLEGAKDPEEVYRRTILPDKLALSARYQAHRCFRTDVAIVGLTARYSFIPFGFDPQRIRQKFGW